ncbi:hypothetical protein BDR07DRAFT_1379140 [Suillus spraguei]|nr:hypothetical protein BDR07DRAFT_1379140 [Suillus spraguei]
MEGGTSKGPVEITMPQFRLSKSRKRKERMLERYRQRLAEQRIILFTKYQMGTQETYTSCWYILLRRLLITRDEGLPKRDICKQIQKETRAKRKALAKAEQEAKRKAAQLLTDIQAPLVEKEAELFATRDTAYKDTLLAAERSHIWKRGWKICS